MLARDAYRFRANVWVDRDEETKCLWYLLYRAFAMVTMAGDGARLRKARQQWLVDCAAQVRRTVSHLAFQPSMIDLAPCSAQEYYDWTVRWMATVVGQVLSPDYAIQDDWTIPIADPSPQEELGLELLRAFHRLSQIEYPAHVHARDRIAVLEPYMAGVYRHLERIYHSATR